MEDEVPVAGWRRGLGNGQKVGLSLEWRSILAVHLLAFDAEGLGRQGPSHLEIAIEDEAGIDQVGDLATLRVEDAKVGKVGSTCGENLGSERKSGQAGGVSEEVCLVGKEDLEFCLGSRRGRVGKHGEENTEEKRSAVRGAWVHVGFRESMGLRKTKR
jgi:hypothetical protein